MKIYGYADASYFGGKIPISGAAGDQQAALFGQTCFYAGEAKKYIWNRVFPSDEYRTEPVYLTRSCDDDRMGTGW